MRRLRQGRLAARGESIQVLSLIVGGFSNREIGLRLSMSESTASVHVSHVLSKLGVTTRVEAAAIAIRSGLDS